MNTRTEEFIVSNRPRLSLKVPSGSVTLHEGPPNEIRVTVTGRSAEEFEINQSDNTVVVAYSPRRGGSATGHDVVVVAPPRTSVTGQLASADFRAGVPLDDAHIVTASGDIDIEHARDADLKTASGDVTVASTDDRTRVRTASGDVVVGTTADLSVVTASGDVRVEQSHATSTVKTASGAIRVATFDGPSFSAKTVSGDVYVGVHPGRSIRVDIQSLSGDINLPSDPADASGTGGPSLKVRARTVSGDINLAIAQPAD